MSKYNRNPMSLEIRRSVSASLQFRGISRSDFAKQLGLSMTTVANWFQKDFNIPINRLVLVCNKLKDRHVTKMCIDELQKIIDSDKDDRSKFRYVLIKNELSKLLTNQQAQGMMPPKDKAKIQKYIDDVRQADKYTGRWKSLTPRQIMELVHHLRIVIKATEPEFFKATTESKLSVQTMKSFLKWIDQEEK